MSDIVKNMLTESNLDLLVSGLGGTLLTSEDSFEEEAKKKAAQLTSENIDYLISKLHDPPMVDSRINEQHLRLGQWQAVCQYSIFELIYHVDSPPLKLLKRFAYGEYDWTQATALEVICRMYVNGEISYNIIEEIDDNLKSMRHETHLYLAQGLLARANKDSRFRDIINQFKNTDFHNAVKELTDK